jgi:hypothetical protein
MHAAHHSMLGQLAQEFTHGGMEHRSSKHFVHFSFSIFFFGSSLVFFA